MRILALSASQVHFVKLRWFAVTVVLLLLIGLLRRRAWLGVAVASAAIVAVAGSDALKLVGLPHPELVPGATGILSTGTFPSGHTVTVMACALALVVVVPARWRGAAAVAAGGFTCLVAIEVQTALWHRPSDSIGGAFLAFAVISGALALVARFRPDWLRPARPNRVALTLLCGTAVVAAGATAWGVLAVVGKLPVSANYAKMPVSVGYAVHLAALAGTVVVIAGLLAVLLLLIGTATLRAEVPSRVPAWPRPKPVRSY
jgi:membrane-associated phospholipid phosphatase